MHIPYSALELIEFLERAFAPRSPDLNDAKNLPKMWMEAGKVELVRDLRISYEEQLREEAEIKKEKGDLNVRNA